MTSGTEVVTPVGGSIPISAEVLSRYLVPPRWYQFKPLLHVALAVSSVALASTTPSPWRIPLVILAGTQLVGVFTTLHDASHGVLAESIRRNDQIGVLLGILLCTSFSAYRECHMLHHEHLRKEGDTQEVIHTVPSSRLGTGALLLFASIFGAVVFLWVRVPVTGFRLCPRARVGIELAAAIGFYFLLLFGICGEGERLLVVAAVVVAIVVGSLLDITYHQGLPTSGGLESSRSFDSDRLGLWFLNGSNRHAEHHAFPRIPGPILSALSKEIRESLEEEGVAYSPGYTFSFIDGLVRGPLFLPPLTDIWHGGES